jgi:hypothetical protein
MTLDLHSRDPDAVRAVSAKLAADRAELGEGRDIAPHFNIKPHCAWDTFGGLCRDHGAGGMQCPGLCLRRDSSRDVRIIGAKS